MSFVESFFTTLSNLTNTNFIYDLVLSNQKIIKVSVVSNSVHFETENLENIQILKNDFVPCYCDSGHPILSALRNFDKPCICSSETYIKILQRSNFPTKSILARVIGHCLSLKK